MHIFADPPILDPPPPGWLKKGIEAAKRRHPRCGRGKDCKCRGGLRQSECARAGCGRCNGLPLPEKRRWKSEGGSST